MDRLRMSLDSVLATTLEQPAKRLSDSDLAHLGLLVVQMVKRYPSQDLADSIEGYLFDFQQLALKYSLRRVEEALAVLRIKPSQSFFPRPDEVAEEIDRRLETESVRHRRKREEAERAQRNHERWEWFDGRIAIDGQVCVNGRICRTDAEFIEAGGNIGPRPAYRKEMGWDGPEAA